MAPGLVLLTLKRVLQRDSILQKKIILQDVENISSIFINADKAVGVQRNKAVLRKIAYNARNAGNTVIFKHDCGTINGIKYTLDTLHKVPPKFCPAFQTDGMTTRRERDDARPKVNVQTPQAEEGTVGEDVDSRMEQAPTELSNSTIHQDMIREKGTVQGLRKDLCDQGWSLFFRPISIHIKYVTHTSNLQRTDYDSNEQAIQCTISLVHDQPTLAAALKGTDDSYKIKKDGGAVTTTKQWKRKMPNRLWKLFNCKMRNNPELLHLLLETNPAPLVEASYDKT